MSSSDPPKVPLEAGIGPANPPCPACGEPLFAWSGSPAPEPLIARRCESCGLGVMSAIDHVSSPEEATAALDALGDDAGRVTIVNRAALGASLSGGGWAGFEADRDFYFTPESVRRLTAGRDQLVASIHWQPVASIVLAWQSILNLFTFGRNVALGAFGRSTPAPAGHAWQRGLDAFISIALAIPAAVLAVLVEPIGGLFRRGEVLRLRLIVL